MLWVNFWCEVGTELHSFTCEYPGIQYHLMKRLFFPTLNCLDTFVKNQWTTNVRAFFFGLSILFSWSICLTLCNTTLSWFCSFEVCFEIKNSKSNLLLLFKIVLAILGYTDFHISLKVPEKSPALIVISNELTL